MKGQFWSWKVSGVRSFSIGLLVVLAGVNTVLAAGMAAVPVKLAWDASPDVEVTGYALYYGPAQSSATNRLDLGAVQTVTLTNLWVSTNYFFFVVAYNAAGIESLPSNRVLYAPPALSRLQMGRSEDGTISLLFRAAPGAACRVEYASSANSPQWQVLGTATADANGNVVIADPPGVRPSMRIYRAARQ